MAYIEWVDTEGVGIEETVVETAASSEAKKSE
jgi:hypothetical protein